MKKISCCILSVLIALSLAGCAQKQSSETGMVPDQIAETIIQSQLELPSLHQIMSGDEEFSSWLSDCYIIQSELVADGVICYADDVEASEIAVLVLEDEKNGKVVEKALNEYRQNRSGVFEGYAPQQAALVNDGIVVVNGKYIALLICQDTSAARTAFLSCFDKITENSLENIDDGSDAYDSKAVLQAWKSGEESSLSEMNRRILNVAKDVLQKEVNDSMSDYEKELAIHDWITAWSSFDYSVFERSASDGFEAGSDTPYGVLINRSAMCHGYSSTFQLFMDMLDIECITVFGTPGSNGIEHSWNMVKLDGEWYCVDVAWDDPIGGSPGHTYFNVTSETLRNDNIHHWDDASVPEADATDYAYDNH